MTAARLLRRIAAICPPTTLLPIAVAARARRCWYVHTVVALICTLSLTGSAKGQTPDTQERNEVHRVSKFMVLFLARAERKNRHRPNEPCNFLQG